MVSSAANGDSTARPELGGSLRNPEEVVFGKPSLELSLANIESMASPAGFEPAFAPHEVTNDFRFTGGH